MKLTITINMDGAAFDETPGHEVASILSEVSVYMISYHPLDWKHIIVRDCNGNKCGELVVTETEEN